MSFEYKYLSVVHDGTPSPELVSRYNSIKLPAGILDKIHQEYVDVNGMNHEIGQNLYVPIMPMYFGNYDTLISKEEALNPPIKKPISVKEPITQDEVIESVPTEKIVVETIESVPDLLTSENKTEELPLPSPQKVISEERPIKSIGKIKYRSFPYTFARPGDTIEAVIRLYNDLNVSRPVINKLLYEFSRINKDAMPPKLGQTVQVPVLLPFAYRHQNNNKIFNE